MASGEGLITLMTYNVHRLIGIDRHTSAARIAQVITAYDPDVIALQELPGGRFRPEAADPAHDLINAVTRISSNHGFILMERERCGNVTLSRFPMRLIRAGGLHSEKRRRSIVPRGALWVEIEVGGRPLQLINTHLGLTPPERSSQVRVLTGPEWLGHPACQAPIILCGDFNTLPGSPIHERLKGSLKDVQERLSLGHNERTFPSRYPMLRLDHLFVSPELSVENIQIPQTELSRIASDHLPLVITLRMP